MKNIILGLIIIGGILMLIGMQRSLHISNHPSPTLTSEQIDTQTKIYQYIGIFGAILLVVGIGLNIKKVS